LDTQAQAHVLMGELDEARKCWLEAVECWVDTGWELSGYLFGLALVAGLEGEKEAALRLHFAAERMLADLNLTYPDPIAVQERELLAGLAEEVGQEVADRLRSESAGLESSGDAARSGGLLTPK
jgi:hypothetical protein